MENQYTTFPSKGGRFFYKDVKRLDTKENGSIIYRRGVKNAEI